MPVAGAVSFRRAEILKRAGTLVAQLAQYRQEREKLQADRETIQKAGPEGPCPLCRQKLGKHFWSLEEEFSARIRNLEQKTAADRGQQEQLEKERARVEALRPALNTPRSLAGNLKLRDGHGKDLAELRANREKRSRDRQELAEAQARIAHDDAAYLATGMPSRKDAGRQSHGPEWTWGVPGKKTAPDSGPACGKPRLPLHGRKGRIGRLLLLQEHLPA